MLATLQIPKSIFIQEDGFCYDPWGEQIIIGAESGKGFFRFCFPV
jgi:hypothetical protein